MTSSAPVIGRVTLQSGMRRAKLPGLLTEVDTSVNAKSAFVFVAATNIYATWTMGKEH